MKTAVSIPDRLFAAADELATKLGLSRSELYARALVAYLEDRRDENVTRRLNEIYAREDSTLDPAVVQLQSASLERDDW